VSRERRLTSLVVFVLLFTSYAYFYQGGGWNQNSRFALVRSITSQHTLRIDAFASSTGDRALYDGHYYCDKAPGLSLTAVPLVAVARAVLFVFGRDPDDPAGLAFLSYLATVLIVGLPTALAGVSLYSLVIKLGASPGGAFFAAIGFGLGTPTWALATIFIGHAFSAALLVLAFASACRVGTDPGSSVHTDLSLGALIGSCAGWATVSEFPAAVPAVLIASLALVNARQLRRNRALRVLGAMTATALGAAAGAGGGFLFGSSSGLSAAQYSGGAVQQRYDNAYQQCMYAKGNQIPGVIRSAYRRAPAPPLPPPPPAGFSPASPDMPAPPPPPPPPPAR